LANIAARIQGQTDDLEFATVKGEYNASLQSIRQNIVRNPEVENPFEEFNKQAEDLKTYMYDKIKSPRVARAFDAHMAATFPEVQRDALDDAFKLQNQKNVAALHEWGDTLATAAGEGTPEERDRAIRDYNDQIDRARGYGTLSPVQAYDSKKLFRQKVMTRNMDAIGRKDPVQLFELNRQGAFSEVEEVTRLKILEETRAKQIADENRAEANYKKAQNANVQHFEFLALDGAIPDSEMEMMLQGHHPYVTDPKDVERLKRLNDNPITSQKSDGSSAIILDYRSQRPTPERINRFRSELDNYRRGNTKKDKGLAAAYKELNDDFDSLEAQGRAERGVVNQERALNISTAEDIYDSVARTIFPGFFGSMQKGKVAADKAKLRDLIRANPKADPRKLAEDLMKIREGESKNVPSKVQDVLKLVP
jgi:hypothetical protein